mgnify:CR=1 FL=1
MLRDNVVVRTSNMNISRRRLADYVKRKHNGRHVRAARAARLFFIIHPIKSMIFGVVVAVVVPIS